MIGQKWRVEMCDLILRSFFFSLTFFNPFFTLLRFYKATDYGLLGSVVKGILGSFTQLQVKVEYLKYTEV